MALPIVRLWERARRRADRYRRADNRPRCIGPEDVIATLAEEARRPGRAGVRASAMLARLEKGYQDDGASP